MTFLKLAWHRLCHWEYWALAWVYYPLFPVWMFYSLKAKSIFFFSNTNPNFTNGGMALESKKEIYDQIPDQYIPKTLLFPQSVGIDVLLNKLKSAGINFPLIAKPDIGMKAYGVEKIKNKIQLQAYIDKSVSDFLIQELIEFPNELGIFYYRIPGEEKGHLSGIVQKEFLTVCGNGKDAVSELIKKNPRSAYQASALKKNCADVWDTVLALDEKHILVPYGSHTRGAMFIDVSYKITPKLTAYIDSICQQVPAFYFGRLDIRFNNFDELENGENFSIIEINGSGSEPTHMYDPKHTLLFAWKEISRHWAIMCRISKINKQNGYNYLSLKDGRAMFKADAILQEKLKLI